MATTTWVKGKRTTVVDDKLYSAAYVATLLSCLASRMHEVMQVPGTAWALPPWSEIGGGGTAVARAM